MIIGMGIDLIEIERITKALQRFGQRFENKIFTTYEQQYAREGQQSAARYAKRFAAKEAFFKALGADVQRSSHWHDVEIRNAPSGQPFINISDKLNTLLKKKYGDSALAFHVSLTDTATLAQAFVIISGKDIK